MRSTSGVLGVPRNSPPMPHQCAGSSCMYLRVELGRGRRMSVGFPIFTTYVDNNVNCIEKKGDNLEDFLVTFTDVDYVNWHYDDVYIALILPWAFATSQDPGIPTAKHLLSLEKWTVDAVCTFIGTEKELYDLPFEMPSPDNPSRHPPLITLHHRLSPTGEGWRRGRI